MEWTIRQAVSSGVHLFFWSIGFFYRHLSLVLISLIPSTFRFIQMWRDLNTPLWMEIVVESTRVVLFLLILALMHRSGFRDVFDSALWQRWQRNLKIVLEHNWPATFIAQIAVFIIGLYIVLNTTLEWLLNPSFMKGYMWLLGIETYDYDQVYRAALYFLKNMSVIPLSMVFILRMLGAGIHVKGGKKFF
jgi:hypothetical protein